MLCSMDQVAGRPCAHGLFAAVLVPWLPQIERLEREQKVEEEAARAQSGPSQAKASSARKPINRR